MKITLGVENICKISNWKIKFLYKPFNWDIQPATFTQLVQVLRHKYKTRPDLGAWNMKMSNCICSGPKNQCNLISNWTELWRGLAMHVLSINVWRSISVTWIEEQCIALRQFYSTHACSSPWLQGGSSTWSKSRLLHLTVVLGAPKIQPSAFRLKEKQRNPSAHLSLCASAGFLHRLLMPNLKWKSQLKHK